MKMRPRLINRPERPSQISREKTGAAAAIAAVIGWAVLTYFGVELPEDVLIGVAVALLAGLQWVARQRTAHRS